MKTSLILILILFHFSAQAKNRCVEESFREDNICIIAGGTADTTRTVNMAHARSMALKTARILAYEKMAEKIHGITVNAYNSMSNDLYDQNELKTIVEATLKNISFENETLQFLSDGSPWAEVTISIPLLKHGEISKNALNFSNGTRQDEHTSKIFVIDLRSSNEAMNFNFEIYSNNQSIFSYNPLKSGLEFIDSVETLGGSHSIITPVQIDAGRISLSDTDGEKIVTEIFNNRKVYILR